MTLALVLAGGGVAGIAWETGFLLGVQDVAPMLASRLIGAEMLLGGGTNYDLEALRNDNEFVNFILGLLATVRAEGMVTP